VLAEVSCAQHCSCLLGLFNRMSHRRCAGLKIPCRSRGISLCSPSLAPDVQSCSMFCRSVDMFSVCWDHIPFDLVYNTCMQTFCYLLILSCPLLGLGIGFWSALPVYFFGHNFFRHKKEATDPFGKQATIACSGWCLPACLPACLIRFVCK